MGGKSTSTSDTKLNGIQVQSSSYGVPITIGWGTFRANCNLIDYTDFDATSHTSTTSAGGKGGGSSSSTTYTYSATILLGICAGPIVGVRTIFQDQSVFTDGATTALAQAGFSLMTGSIGQAPWSYMTSAHPDRALGYSGLAYAYAENYPLTSGASLSNNAFEVQTSFRESGLDDANPADIVTDCLNSPLYGVPQWQPSSLGDLSDYRLFCKASGFLLSPVVDTQRQAADLLTEVVLASNSDAVWSEGLLRIKPYGDTEVTGNGVTWTPDLAPLWEFTAVDILGAGDQTTDPVLCSIVRPADAFNSVQVGFIDRSQQYASDIMPGRDTASILLYGEKKQDVTTINSICDRGVAALVAQTLAQRTANVRRTYTWSTALNFWWLDSLDYVSLTIGRYNQKLVRITQMAESSDDDGNGQIDFSAEEVLVGSGHAPVYSRQSANGFVGDYNTPPGDVQTPILFNPPLALSGGSPEVWAAISGAAAAWGGAEAWLSVDGTTYTRAARLPGRSRYGQSTNSITAVSSPDTTNTLGVDLTVSEGEILPATTAEADAGASLFALGAELMAYSGSVLTATNKYNLTYLVRGLFGTPITSHATGEEFIRLDQAILKYPYTPDQVGQTIYVKFLSFNIYGRAMQDLADVTAYPVMLGPGGTLPGAPQNLRLAVPFAGGTLQVLCDSVPTATGYKFKFYDITRTTLLREIDASAASATYTAAQAAQDGVQRDYSIEVIASNATGDSTPSSWLDVHNPAPAAVTTVSGAAATNPGQANLVYNASTDPDLGGYLIAFSQTMGFDPKTEGAIELTKGVTYSLYGLPPGTWYWRVAPYDPWSSAPGPAGAPLLNFSAEATFSITTGGTAGGGTPSGGGCVEVRSHLPRGGVAGNVVVRSRMLLADPSDLVDHLGEVTFSERKLVPGFRITTEGHATLVCSDTAEIPTLDASLLTPDKLRGHYVAVMRAVTDVRGWERVVGVQSIGMIWVQHITVGDRCFWAGEQAGVYILHHNLKQTGYDGN